MNGRHLIVVGAGGNIGSHLIGHLARMSNVRRITLIDRDRYERHNLEGQDIVPNAIGRFKADVQAKRALRINPAMEAVSFTEDVRGLPLGALRGDLILACLDSLRGRIVVNQAASRLSIPWIDAGILADRYLVRIDVYVPGLDAPCYECRLDDRHYAAIEPAPCHPDQSPGTPEILGSTDYPTGAPAHLGALAASLQALECEKHLQRHPHRLPAGGQVVVDGEGYTSTVSVTAQSSTCRFADHRPWEIELLEQDPGAVTLNWLLNVAGPSHRASAVRIDNQLFVNELACQACGGVRRPLRLEDRLRASDLRCRGCTGSLAADAFSLVGHLEPATLTNRERRRSLRAFGVRLGDVVTVEGEQWQRHFQIGTPHTTPPQFHVERRRQGRA